MTKWLAVDAQDGRGNRVQLRVKASARGVDILAPVAAVVHVSDVDELFAALRQAQQMHEAQR